MDAVVPFKQCACDRSLLARGHTSSKQDPSRDGRACRGSISQILNGRRYRCFRRDGAGCCSNNRVEDHEHIAHRRFPGTSDRRARGIGGFDEALELLEVFAVEFVRRAKVEATPRCTTRYCSRIESSASSGRPPSTMKFSEMISNQSTTGLLREYACSAARGVRSRFRNQCGR